jgi:hypothetical protein
MRERQAAADWPAGRGRQTSAHNTYPTPRTERMSVGRPPFASIFLRNRATSVSIDRSKL